MDIYLGRIAYERFELIERSSPPCSSATRVRPTLVQLALLPDESENQSTVY